MKLCKRVLVLALILALSISVVPVSARGGLDNFADRYTYTPGTFRDIKPGDWFYPGVVTAYEKGLMSGKGNGRFDPNGCMTVGEIVAIGARLHALYHTGTESFAQGSPWYGPYCEYADAQGLIRHYWFNEKHSVGQVDVHHDQFGISSTWPLTCNVEAGRNMFASILVKAVSDEALQPINDIADDQIPDVSMTAIYAEEIYTLYRAGVLVGSNAYGTFEPGKGITRGEAASIIARVIDPSLRKSVTLQPADYTVTGYCGGEVVLDPDSAGALTVEGGENLQYKLDLSTGVLTITGKGTMGFYAPWSNYAFRIREVYIDPAVTTIGAGAFAGCSQLERIELPDAVYRIGSEAFIGCEKLREVNVPASLEAIYEKAFFGCKSLPKLNIPSSVYLSYSVFS